MARSTIYIYIYCSLSLCKTCQTYVLRVQIWVWNLQLPLVLSPVWGSQVNILRIRTPFQEGLPQSRWKFKQYQLQSRLPRGSKKYIEAFTGLTLLYELTWRDVMYLLGQMLTPDLRTRVLGEATTFWRWMAWTWDKGKEGTQNSPPSYWKPSNSNNRAALLDVFLKDLSKCTLRL